MKNKAKQKSPKSFSQKVIEKTHKINLDTMKLLVSRKDFQKKVEEIRKDEKFNIPVGGITDEGEAERWADNLNIKSDKVIDSKSFIGKNKEIFKKRERKEFKSHSEFTNALKELNDTIPLNNFGKVIMDIITFYGIPIHFYRYIKNYILYNIIDAPKLNFAIRRDLESKRIFSEPFMILRKDESKLEKQEVANALQDAENAKYEHLKGFHYGFTNMVLKPYGNIDRDIEIIEKSKNKGTKIEEFLGDKETWEYNDREIASEIWGDKSTKHTIGNQKLIIRQARHRLNKASKKRFKA